MIKLRRLRIDRFRNVLAGTELCFDAHVNLVLGGPGTGKTVLLGLLAAIAGTDFSRLEEEAFELTYDIDDGVFAATVVVVGGGLPPRSPVDGRPEPTDYSYRIGIHRIGGDTVCELHGTPESLVVRVTGGEAYRLPPSAPFRRGFLAQALRQAPASGLFFGAWRLFNWQGTAARFDESLDCFLAMTGRRPAVRGIALPRPAEAEFAFDPRSAVRTSTRYTSDHYLPAGAIDRAIVDAHRSEGGEIFVDVDGGPVLTSTALSSLSFLRRTAQLLGFRGAAFHPDIVSYRNERSTGELHYAVRGFTFRFTRGDGTTLHHDQLSHGQKRLLALFYYLAASEEFVFADEIVHGLHEGWIPAVLEEIGQRQMFLTSQDPRVYAYLGLDSLERVMARVIICEAVGDSGGAQQLRWCGITGDAATTLFRRHARLTVHRDG